MLLFIFILNSLDDYLITWGSRGLMDRESDLQPEGRGLESQVRQELSWGE